MRRFWVEESGVRQLVEDVEYLCGKLGRPVCSKDLLAHYREFPDEQPDKVQALGQQLIKATYARKRASPTLYKIGMVGSFAFYAANRDARWAEALRIHALKLRIADEPLARNAMRGFLDEYLPAVVDPGLRGWKKLSSLRRLIKVAEQHASPVFARIEPMDLIGRKEARALMVREYIARNPEFDPAGHNFNRHLSVLRWPQVGLFPDRMELVYSKRQVLTYCEARWPQSVEERINSGAVWRCLCYGGGNASPPDF